MPAPSEHYFIEDEERNRLLEAIEQQAKSLSMARGNDQHRLSDWLNAAEEVMPEIKKPTVKPMSMTQASNNKPSAINSVVGYLVMGALTLSLATGGTFAYMQVQEQIGLLQKENKELSTQFSDLEKQLAEQVEKKAANTTDAQKTTTHEVTTNQESTSALQQEMLAQKLNEQTQQLQALLDSRVKQMLELMEAQKTDITKPITTAASTISPSNLQQPTTPSVQQPQAPTIVEMSTASNTVTTDNQGNFTDPHQAWLSGLANDSLVLQLGSNIKAEGLNAMIGKIRHNPEMGHVIAVKANGSTRYILVYGAFTSREEAKQASDTLRNDLGVSPWVRRAADVKALLSKS
jgi:septal ring-binding cell division protein DamX